MDIITLIGLTAGTLTSASFLPQIIKTWKTKSAKDISIIMFLVLITGISLWVIYGIIRKDFPVIIANSFTLLFALIILFFKIRFK